MCTRSVTVWRQAPAQASIRNQQVCPLRETIIRQGLKKKTHLCSDQFGSSHLLSCITGDRTRASRAFEAHERKKRVCTEYSRSVLQVVGRDF
eukprot:1160621-Pelagomonas_calceolata.AAC.2